MRAGFDDRRNHEPRHPMTVGQVVALLLIGLGFVVLFAVMVFAAVVLAQ